MLFAMSTEPVNIVLITSSQEDKITEQEHLRDTNIKQLYREKALHTVAECSRANARMMKQQTYCETFEALKYEALKLCIPMHLPSVQL